jgi:hypothetical protein
MLGYLGADISGHRNLGGGQPGSTAQESDERSEQEGGEVCSFDVGTDDKATPPATVCLDQRCLPRRSLFQPH